MRRTIRRTANENNTSIPFFNTNEQGIKPAPFFRALTPQISATSLSIQTQSAVVNPSITIQPIEVRPHGTGGVNTADVTFSNVPNGTVIRPSVSATANSGGHLHSSNRLVGSVTPRSRKVQNGVAAFEYQSSRVSGIETIEANIGGTTISQNITVQVPNLTALGPGANYDLVGQTATHPDNHYATAAMITALQQIAQEYEDHKADNNLTTWPRIAYNDISLEKGGIFDINANWGPPHHTHRQGNIVDFRTRTLNQAQMDVLRPIIENNGGVILNEGDHWHLTFAGAI